MSNKITAERIKLKETVTSQVTVISGERYIENRVATVFDEIYDMGCNTFNKWAMFLSQCSHESVGFTVLEENLNYSKKSLLRVFGKYFNDETASFAARKPNIIGDIVYGNRMGNNDKEGYLYRGRGYIMLTGKNNYIKYGFIDNIELLYIPEYAFIAAARFFTTNRLWADSDKLNVKTVTRVINGGYNGLDDRMERLKMFCAKPVNAMSTVIKLGSRGPRVVAIQESLLALGYIDADNVDGIFGPDTHEEIKEYQANNGLVVDGIVGDKTFKKLISSI